jgi:alpha-methylacyl-CoA racemase
VVDAAMLDGASLLMSMMYGYRAMGRWTAPRAGNMFDGSAYYYRCYRCADDRWIAVGAIEPQFRTLFLEKLGLGPEQESIVQSPDNDPQVHARIAAIIRAHDRSHWEQVFTGTDACVAPVLSMEEAAMHPHNRYRETFSMADGITQPQPAPRFSRTRVGEWQADSDDAKTKLAEWGLSPHDLLRPDRPAT